MRKADYVAEVLKLARVKKISLKKLRLDPQNVRFSHTQELISDEQIEEYIWKEQGARKLYKQILEVGGLLEKPVVDHRNIVLEGNRRVVCLRKLAKDAHAGKLDVPPHKFDLVECYALPKKAKEAEIDVYLAAIHVTGKKPWDVFNKAKHITSLHNEHGFGYDIIARALGMGKNTVKRYEEVYNITDDYGQLHPEDKEWWGQWIYFDELFRKKELYQFRMDSANIKKFGEWLAENKFKNSRDVRVLHKILGDEVALEAFIKKDARAAMDVLAERDPTFTSAEFKKIKKVIDLLRSFPRRELVAVLEDNSRMVMLRNLKKETDELLNYIESIRKRNLVTNS